MHAASVLLDDFMVVLASSAGSVSVFVVEICPPARKSPERIDIVPEFIALCPSLQGSVLLDRFDIV